MKINIINIIPKDWLIKEFGDKIEVTYISKRGNYNRKSFVFPKEIKIDTKFVEGLAFYLGDGDYNKKDKNHLAATSKDKELAKMFLDFLRDYFYIKDKDITLLVQYKKDNKDLIKEWAEFLNIDKSKILTRFSDRHKEETIAVQVNGVVFRKIFEIIIKKLLNSNFIFNTNLRRAFLRGLFAAEGNVGIDYLEKKPYISQITFNLNIKEESLREIICKGLDLEEIFYRIRRDYKDNSLEINIQRWDNYLKLWNINLFDGCQRKKDKFIGISKNLDIYLRFNPYFRVIFFDSLNMRQKEIAKKINSWQANVCRTIDGKHLLRIEQIMNLLPNSKYNKNDLFRNTEELRIGSLTKMKPDKAMINFLREFKSF